MDRKRFAFLLLAAAALVLRLYQCMQVPANTGDVVRNLLYGAGVSGSSLAFAGGSLADAAPHLAWVSWSESPYNYPPVALLFFTALSFLPSSVFVAKLALTAVEGANAWLVARVSEDRWCGLIVWIAPAGVWWTSREGQFESLQSLFALLAILALRGHRTALAFGLLAVSIQTKLLSIVLLPWFLRSLWSGGAPEARSIVRAAAGFAAGCIPTCVAMWYYPAVRNVLEYSSPMTVNHFHWLPVARYMKGMPLALDIWMQVLAWVVTGIAAAGAWKSRDRFACLPALLFVAVLRTSPHALFWYWLAMIPAIAAIPDVRFRRALFAAWMLVEGYSACQLAGGPFSSQVGAGYYDFGLYTPVSEL